MMNQMKGPVTYLLNMSVMRSISCSAAAIFSADEGCGRPKPNIDMTVVCIDIPSNGEFEGGRLLDWKSLKCSVLYGCMPSVAMLVSTQARNLASLERLARLRSTRMLNFSSAPSLVFLPSSTASAKKLDANQRYVDLTPTFLNTHLYNAYMMIPFITLEPLRLTLSGA